MDRDESMKVGKYEGYVIRDEDATDPREWDNLGRMVCGHRRYHLGDTSRTLGWTFDINAFSSWAEVEQHLYDEEGAAVVLPLYLYDHSGITMSTKPFSCAWDSGQVGFIYITKSALRENWPGLDTEDEKLEHARKCLEAEVETYDAYLTGDVYGWQIVDADGEHVDSCYSYFGDAGRKEAGEDMRRELEAHAGRAARHESERAHYATEC